MKRYEINAVHDDDLETFLNSLGLLEDLKNKKLKCNVCKCSITKDNLGCVYPFKDKIEFCCQKYTCYEKILPLIGSKHD